MFRCGLVWFGVDRGGLAWFSGGLDRSGAFGGDQERAVMMCSLQ